MGKNRRVIMRIELSATAKDLFVEIAGRQGMTQLATNSRLAEWFCRQSDEVQRAILIDFANGKANEFEIVKMILKSMAG